MAGTSSTSSPAWWEFTTSQPSNIKQTIYLTVPAHPTSCAVNIALSGNPATTTSVLANPDGSFITNPAGDLIPAAKPFCTPFTRDNVRTTTITSDDDGLQTTTIAVFDHSTASHASGTLGVGSHSSGRTPSWVYDNGPYLSAGAIAGMSIGAVSAFLILCGLVFFFLRRRRVRKAKASSIPLKAIRDDSIEDQPPEYGDNPDNYAWTPQVTRMPDPEPKDFDKDSMATTKVSTISDRSPVSPVEPGSKDSGWLYKGTWGS